MKLPRDPKRPLRGACLPSGCRTKAIPVSVLLVILFFFGSAPRQRGWRTSGGGRHGRLASGHADALNLQLLCLGVVEDRLDLQQVRHAGIEAAGDLPEQEPVPVFQRLPSNQSAPFSCPPLPSRRRRRPARGNDMNQPWTRRTEESPWPPLSAAAAAPAVTPSQASPARRICGCARRPGRRASATSANRG